MWEIINEIRRSSTMNGDEVSRYSRFVLGRKEKSAGGCLARGLQYHHISIVGTTYVGSKEVNIYA